MKLTGDTLAWFSMIASVPIGVASGLAVPKIQQWLERSSKKQALAVTENMQKEYKQIENFRLNPNDFTQYLIYVVLRATLIGTVTGVGASVFYVAQGVIESFPLYVAGQALTSLGAIMIINLCTSALSTWNKVKNFDEYKAAVDQHMQKNVNTP